ncbi:hypothetical protein [Nocardiopsis quinghaiensis]|uniref:hypothetical protein n=1 Tax=Nocardiopsis quinghaiensis TaxID=464995 RepID=UPI001CC26423|nr:hypothetical protein [Nocardiopsis quinghaiensis]
MPPGSDQSVPPAPVSADSPPGQPPGSGDSGPPTVGQSSSAGNPENHASPDDTDGQRGGGDRGAPAATAERSGQSTTTATAPGNDGSQQEDTDQDTPVTGTRQHTDEKTSAPPPPHGTGRQPDAPEQQPSPASPSHQAPKGDASSDRDNTEQEHDPGPEPVYDPKPPGHHLFMPPQQTPHIPTAPVPAPGGNQNPPPSPPPEGNGGGRPHQHGADTRATSSGTSSSASEKRPPRDTDGIPAGPEGPPRPRPTATGGSAEGPGLTPVPTGTGTPRTAQGEESPPPSPGPAPAETDGTAPGATLPDLGPGTEADTDLGSDSGTDGRAPETPPPSPPDRRPPPPPSGDAEVSPVPPPPRPDGADTTGGSRGETPPDPRYPGSVTPDRSRDDSYDLSYLLTSSLVNASMVHAQHLQAFVDDALTGDTGHAGATTRDAVREQVARQARRDMGVFFGPDGFSTTVTDADGSTWRANVRLRPSGDGFHHAPTRTERGPAAPELKLVDEAGEANPAEGSGGHGGNKFVGLGFQVSPLLLGTVGATDIGPRFSVSFSGGTRQRQSGETTASLHDGYTSYEIKGKPEVYASDLAMSLDLSPVPATADGQGHVDGPANRGVSARSDSPNGVLLVLPGKVVPNAGPRSIRLRDPFATEDHQRGRDEDAGPAGPHADKGHPVSVGDIRPSDGSSDKAFPDWIADRLWSPEQDRGWWRPMLDKMTPAFVEKRRQQRMDAFLDQVGETFSPRSVRNNLPKMTSGPAVFPVTDPSGTPRLVSIRSVPTSYRAKSHSIPPGKYVKGNKAERESGSSLRHSDVLGGTLGAGVSVDAGVTGGSRRARVDALAVEGGVRGRSTEESSRSSSGSANRMNYGSKAETSAYDVQRNYYVHFDGDPTVYRFQGDTVEILTVQEARMLSGDEPSDKVPAPVRAAGSTADAPGDQRSDDQRTGDQGAGGGQRGDTRPPVLRPPRPNLAEDRPVTFHGAVPREFTWPDGSQYHDVDGHQRSIYQQIAYEVLQGLADKRPGLVLPELARDSRNFARRPGHENTGPLTGSTHEHRPFRRDHGAAVFNTHRVMDAISASVFKSGTDDLTLHGQPIHLIETGRFDPSALFRPGGDVLRPPFVSVRVTADFSSLQHTGETRRGTGGEYTGAAERTTGDGRQTRKTVRLTTGAYIRRTDAVDAAENPRDGGVLSVSGQLSSTRGEGRGLGVKTQSEEIIQYAEDSSVWNSTVRFSAKLYENDDLGMVLGGDTPLADRGTDLLNAPVEALATMDTAKGVPDGGRNGRDGAPPRATRIQPIPVDRAKAMIDGHTSPEPDRVRKRRDVTGTVRGWFGRGPDHQPPGGGVPGTAQQNTGTTGTGQRGSGDGQQNTGTTGTGQRGSGDGQQNTGARPDTGQAPTHAHSTPAPDPGAQNQDRNTPDDDAGTRTPEQRRAALIRDLGATIEHVNTRFSTGDGNRVGSLLDAAYENFSSVPPWEAGGGVQRTPGRFGFERKLRHFLVRGQGSRQFYENALSPENLAGNPALRSSGGARTRTEMSGGPLSPHHVRATTSTRFDIDSVDRFEQSDGAIVWKGKNNLEVFTRAGRRTDLTVLASGGGRYNPNPVQSTGQPADGTAPEPAPDSAGAPLVQLGPSAGRSLLDRHTNTKPSSKFSEAVEFHPKIPMSYAFSASGRVTQAMEFAKNWSIGPTIPRAARYRGWEAQVRDLVTGLVHIRDAHQAGLVEDRVVETGDGLVRVPQPEPEAPRSVRPRPGFEDSGKLVRPADPDRALQNLANDLASQGWELTKDSRETILHTLSSPLGLNPGTGAPVPVKVRPIGHSIGDLNAPTTAPLSLDATVNLRLDRGETEVQYLGGKTEYRQKQGWEDGDRVHEGSESSVSAGAQGALLTPLPRSGGDQPGGTTPSSRPYLMGLYGDASSANAHGEGGSTRNTDKRAVGLTMETPYARVSSDTRLTIDLHISNKQGFANTLTGESPGPGGRRDFTGTGGSGRVEALYPTPYLDLSAGGDGTAGETAGGRRGGNPTAPENPSDEHHASIGDMLRNWSRANDPRSRSGFEDAVVLPAAVGNRGQDVRDLGHVVVAKSLGWTPPEGSVRDGRYTPEAVRRAGEYAADELGLNSRNNAIDHSLNAIALKALFPGAHAEAGTELIQMGRTRWGVRAAPDPGSARIVDYNPNMRLTDSSETGRTFSPTRNQSSTTTMGMDARPSGRTGTGPPTTATHHGSANTAGSSTSGGDTARGSRPKEPPHSDRVRTGPAYLVEIDTRWAIGARSELRGPAYKRAVKYVGNKFAAAGKYTAAKTRGAFGGRDTPSPVPERPARWQWGETSAPVTVWVSHGDAVKLGVLTPGDATRIGPLTERFANDQKALGAAEKAYLEARLPLDKAAADRVASPDDPDVRQRYDDLEAAYQDRLEKFNSAERTWEASLRALRDGLGGPSSPPRPRTASAPSLDTIEEEPPPPPRPNADDPAADPDAVPLPDRGAGQRGTGPNLLDRLGSDLNIRPKETDPEETERSGTRPVPAPVPAPGPAPDPDPGPEPTFPPGWEPTDAHPPGPGTRSSGEWNRFFETVGLGQPPPPVGDEMLEYDPPSLLDVFTSALHPSVPDGGGTHEAASSSSPPAAHQEQPMPTTTSGDARPPTTASPLPAPAGDQRPGTAGTSTDGTAPVGGTPVHQAPPGEQQDDASPVGDRTHGTADTPVPEAPPAPLPPLPPPPRSHTPGSRPGHPTGTPGTGPEGAAGGNGSGGAAAPAGTGGNTDPPPAGTDPEPPVATESPEDVPLPPSPSEGENPVFPVPAPNLPGNGPEQSGAHSR